MEYGRCYAANFTAHEREVTIRTNIGLADGKLLPGSTSNVTVEDPMNDGVNRRCQWWPFGPLYKSGYCRNITVQFRAKLDAGTPGGIGTNHSTLGGSYSVAGAPREFVISDVTPTNTAFTFQDVVLSMLPNTTMVLTVPLDNQDGTKTVLKTSMTLASGSFGQSYNQITDVLGTSQFEQPAAIIESDQINSTNADSITYRVASRAYPEFVTGSDTTRRPGNKFEHHSFWQECAFRLNSGKRDVDVWWWFGNSFITRDDASQSWPPSLPRATHTNQYIADDITLEIYGPRVCGLWATASIIEETESETSTGFWYTKLTLNSLTAAKDLGFSRYPHFNDGVAFPPIRMTFFYDNVNGSYALSPIETSTLAALTADKSGSAWVTAVGSTWKAQEQSYGPYGSIPGRPGEENIPANTWIYDDTTAFKMAGNYAHRVWNTFQNRKPYQIQVFGFSPNGGATAGHPCFCTKMWPMARTGFPDMRGMIFDCYLESNRCNKFKEENVDSIDPSNYINEALLIQPETGQTQKPEPITQLAYWVGRPHIESSGARIPTDQCHALGKRQSRGRNHVAIRSDGGGIAESWYPHDVQHIGIDEFIFTYLLTADIGLQYLIKPFHVAVALATRPHREGVWNADQYNNGRLKRGMTSKWGWTNSAMICGDWSPRGEGRGAIGSTMHLWWVTGDQRLLRKCMLRKETIYKRPESDEPGGYPTNVWADPAATDHGIWRTPDFKMIHRGEDFGGRPLNRNQCYQPWQVLLWTWYSWSWVRALRLADTSTMDWSDITSPLVAPMTAEEHANELEDIIYEQTKAMVDHGFQFRNTGAGNQWIPYGAVHLNWDPAEFGKALPAAVKNVSPPPTNPNTGLPYFSEAAYWHFVWIVGAPIIGWEIASSRGDTEYMNKFAQLLDPTVGGYSIRPASDSWYGWETNINDNSIEYAAVVPDPFKNRNGTPTYNLNSVIAGSTNITAGSISGTWSLPNKTIQGNTTILGSVTVAGGTVWDVGPTTIIGSTSFTIAEPIKPTDIIFAEVAVGPSTLNGATTITGSTSLIDTRQLGPHYIAGSTQFTRNVITWYKDVPFDSVFTLSGKYQYNYYIKSKVGKMPQKYQTLEIFEGNSSLINVNVEFEPGYDDAIIAANQVKWYMANKPKGTVYVSKDLSDGLTIYDSNVIRIEIDSDDTLDLNGDYYHELYITDTTGKVITLMTGKIHITPAFARF